MSYRDHALREFEAAGWKYGADADDPQQWMMDGVLKLLEAMSEQGHSGASAPYMVNLFKSLASFEPITPLTGIDSEWLEYTPGHFQNKRCGHVFKDESGTYDSEGIIWRDPDGSCCTNFESRVPVTFPYTPKREYRNRYESIKEG